LEESCSYGDNGVDIATRQNNPDRFAELRLKRTHLRQDLGIGRNQTRYELELICRVCLERLNKTCTVHTAPTLHRESCVQKRLNEMKILMNGTVGSSFATTVIPGED
jgi:hypothetical protein